MNGCIQAYVVDASTHLLSCSQWGGAEQGIYRSEDGGDSWFQVSPTSGGRPPLVASDGVLYWAAETYNGLQRSEDQGLTWSATRGGALVSAIRPIELPDGRIASTTNEYVVVSDDRGDSWRRVSARMPYKPDYFAYSAFQKAFFIISNLCQEAISSNAIMRYDFDYEIE